jgi:hypothetical protein
VPKKDILFVGIDPDLNKDFRDVIGKVKGCNRGSLREATEEAIHDWIRKNRQAM